MDHADDDATLAEQVLQGWDAGPGDDFRRHGTSRDCALASFSSR
jgi:hypothetical protein